MRKKKWFEPQKVRIVRTIIQNYDDNHKLLILTYRLRDFISRFNDNNDTHDSFKTFQSGQKNLSEHLPVPQNFGRFENEKQQQWTKQWRNFHRRHSRTDQLLYERLRELRLDTIRGKFEQSHEQERRGSTKIDHGKNPRSKYESFPRDGIEMPQSNQMTL